MLRFLVFLLPVVLAACGVSPQAPEPTPSVGAPPASAEQATAPPPKPAAVEPAQAAPPGTKPAAVASPGASNWVAASFADLPGWAADDHAAALKAFLLSCQSLENRDPWRGVCQSARKLATNNVAAARRFFETNFQVFRVTNGQSGDEGLITGYYEPLLQGSRKQSSRFRFPLYGVPDDLIVVDLAELYPELKGLRLRGRLEGRRVVPYYTRAQIDRREPTVPAKVLFWVDDPVELFFLQVQGSGQIRLDSGERVRVGYGDQNGHPYRSIGRYLIDRGELTIEQASMQGIKSWAQQNPDKLAPVLHQNASYVFFRELPNNLAGPLGALGVPVSAGRTLAIDTRYVPLGAPVYLATTWPNSTRPLQRLMHAQDTGSAIRGAVRGDYYWGYGEQAGTQAGRMQQRGRMWLLVPIGASPQSLLNR